MCQNCSYKKYKKIINQLLDNTEYYYASKFLFSIKNFIKKYRHITKKQEKSLLNIINHPVNLQDDEFL